MNALLGEKMGMTQIFEEDRAIPVTVLRAGPCRVAQVKTEQRDGYAAVQLAYGERKQRRVNMPEAGHFAKAGVGPARHVIEVKVEDSGRYQTGQEIRVGEVFSKGMKADVSGISKGKGFAGVMKRHNFSGQLASHGVHRVHRAPGAIGACATPARVFRGMRMAGRMGGERTTILNLEVIDVDHDHSLLLVRGAVPGPRGSVVLIRHGAKAGLQEVTPVQEAKAEGTADQTAEGEELPGTEAQSEDGVRSTEHGADEQSVEPEEDSGEDDDG